MKGSAADMTGHKSCVDPPIITGIFLTQHVSVAAGPDLAAASQPEHGQSWPESQQRGNTLQQAQTKLSVTSTDEGGKAVF